MAELDILWGDEQGVRAPRCYQCPETATKLVLAHPATTFSMHPVYLALCDRHAEENAGLVLPTEAIT